jgi:hypothetical protein
MSGTLVTEIKLLKWPQVRRQRSSEVSCSSQNDGWQLKSERFQLHVWRHCLTIVGTMDRKSFNTDIVWCGDWRY